MHPVCLLLRGPSSTHPANLTAPSSHLPPQAAGQAGAALASARWGSDYLLKVHKALPGANQSMLVTRVRARRGAGGSCAREV